MQDQWCNIKYIYSEKREDSSEWYEDENKLEDIGILKAISFQMK